MTQTSEAAAREPSALVRRFAFAATALATISLAAVCVVGWIPIWPCTLLEHFRVQYLTVGLIVLGATVALRMRGYLDAAAITMLVHGFAMTPDLAAASPSAAPGGVPLRVLILNVHTQSSGFAEVRRLIADESPDLIGLVEVDRRWLDALAPAVAGYRARIEQPRGGVALYSRGTLAGGVEYLGGARPTIVADAAIGAARVRVLLTHPLPPINAFAHADQRRQLEAIADRARQSTLPLLVMGDFNTTPWARPFLRLLHRSGLCDSRGGFGIQASYPATSALVRIPIDHLLASCTIGVRDRRIGPDVGSDHLPVIADLAVPPPSR